MIQAGKWRIDIVSGGRFLHDGGVLYGIVPQSIWKNVQQPDAQNLVPLAMNCLLARDGQNCILVDTGHGSKLSPLDRKSHGLFPGWPLLDELAKLDVAPKDVNYVILSHLHWDHSGGATSRVNQELVATFPSAKYVINRQEWQDAISGQSELSGGYVPDDFQPLEQMGQLQLVEHLEEVLPGVQVLQTGGHTRGHQAVLVQNSGEGVIFLGDIGPTAAHIRRLWCTSYDLDLIRTRQAKGELFRYAADNNFWVVWNHDPEVLASRIQLHPKREFQVVSPLGSSHFFG
ncbi:MBL fold metallo-hydrolase [bacterium]|nr:MBL fold metallo-hydrolase [bacterium]